MTMSVDLIVAIIKRREQNASDSAKRLALDPSLRASEFQHRAVLIAMTSLRYDIEHYAKASDREG